MILSLRLVIGLLACVALASALPGLFPREKVTTYKYYAEVRSQTFFESSITSNFLITGLMHVRPEISDPNLKNAFYVSLDVTHGIRNGEIESEKISEDRLQPLPEAAKSLKDPFVVVFDDNGKIKAVMVNKNENEWSRNMKRAIASMVQVDVSPMNLQMPVVAQSFNSTESTVYGDCTVTYKLQGDQEKGEKMFTVVKQMDPMKCTKYDQYTFNSEESMDCFVEKPVGMGAMNEKVLDIENNGADLLIKKLTSFGMMAYYPWKDGSDVHNVVTKQMMVFESSVPVGSITLPTLNMAETDSLNDVTFQKSQSKYATKAGVDLTYGRHVVNTENLVTELVELLHESADYMNENHAKMAEPDMKHGQTMNRILDVMSLMDFPSFEEVTVRITDGTSNKDVTTRKMFLQMLPYVGTEASASFILHMVHEGKVPDLMAVSIVAKIPFYVRAPTEELLDELEGLLNLGDQVTRGIRDVGILAFATLIHKAHRYQKYQQPLNPEVLNKYVNYYYEHMMNATSYEMRMLYMQSMRNIGAGDVFKLLKPIVIGEVVLPEKPQQLRVMAIHAFEGVKDSGENIDELFGTILKNKDLPLEIRVAALTVILRQPPNMERFMKLLVLMETEQNEHLYKYYYTTMKSFANSSSSCLTPLKEMARTVLLDIRARRPASHLITGVKRMDYENDDYGFGESWTLNQVADEHTGKPFCTKVEYSANDWQSPVNHLTLLIRAEGLDNIYGGARDIFDISLEERDLPMEKINNLLKKAKEDMPGEKPIHFEFAVMHQGRYVMSKYFDAESLPESAGNLFILFFVGFVQNIPSWQEIMFDKLYTKQVSNDLGLPTVFETKMPRVFSAQKTINSIPRALDIKFNAKYWNHGYQSMSVYNPIVDTWHAIRRVSAVDLSLPFEMSIKFPEDGHDYTLTFPRHPKTQYSTSYYRIYHKNYVMILGVEKDMLEQYCPSCNSTQVVRSGTENDTITTLFHKECYETGLKFTAREYDCNHDSSSINNPSVTDKFIDEIDGKSFKELIALGVMTLREYERHLRTIVNVGDCGYLSMIEPSDTYPTSQIDINVDVSGTRSAARNMLMTPAAEYKLNVSLEAKAVSTEDIMASWAVASTWNSTEGHQENDLQLEITGRKFGKEDILKICIDAYKSYPPVVVDPFARNVDVNQKTTATLGVVAGVTDIDTCPADGIKLRVEMEGRMSNEQKEALLKGPVHDGCQTDIENPLYMYAESSIVPRTIACSVEALLHTNLREYVWSITSGHEASGRSILSDFESVGEDLSRVFTNNVTTLPEHTEQNNIKMKVEFPLNSEGLSLNVRTPSGETRFTDILADDSQGWTSLMDNTYFPSNVLDNIVDGEIKFCVIYPEIMANADLAVAHYTVPEQWTLVIGDYKTNVFSVFVKSIQPKKLGLLISITNHTVEIIPTDANPTVTVDGEVVSYENGLVVPENGDKDDVPTVRMVWNSDPKRFRIVSKSSKLDLEWTERFVSMGISTDLQGGVTGLCGQLDGTSKNGIPRVYTLDV